MSYGPPFEDRRSFLMLTVTQGEDPSLLLLSWRHPRLQLPWHHPSPQVPSSRSNFGWRDGLSGIWLVVGSRANVSRLLWGYCTPPYLNMSIRVRFGYTPHQCRCRTRIHLSSAYSLLRVITESVSISLCFPSKSVIRISNGMPSTYQTPLLLRATHLHGLFFLTSSVLSALLVSKIQSPSQGSTFSRIHGVLGSPVIHWSIRMSTVVDALSFIVVIGEYQFCHSQLFMSTSSSDCRSRPSHFRSRLEFSRIQHELMEIRGFRYPAGWVTWAEWLGSGRTLDAGNIFRGVSFPNVRSFRSYLDAVHLLCSYFAWSQNCSMFLRFLFQNALT